MPGRRLKSHKRKRHSHHSALPSSERPGEFGLVGGERKGKERSGGAALRGDLMICWKGGVREPARKKGKEAAGTVETQHDNSYNRGRLDKKK